MDAVIVAAGHALAHGDVLGALKRVALRDDPAALALRGLAMAQMGELERARALLKSAARRFGPREIVAKARCRLAETEIALVLRNLNWPETRLTEVRSVLTFHGDQANATHALQLEARRLLLLGKPDRAEALLQAASSASVPAQLAAGHHLIEAGIAMRRLQVQRARQALAEAGRHAERSGIAALQAEAQHAWQQIDDQMVLVNRHGSASTMTLDEIEPILASPALVVDACRSLGRMDGQIVPLATRPVLFALLLALAQAWPADVTRANLLSQAFGARFTDESHRARLRVEIGRLRTLMASMADIRSTHKGYRLAPRSGRDVVVLAPPRPERHAALLALLADGEAWSSSALALALGTSARTVQRALEELVAADKVQRFGKGPAQRWIARPLLGFPTTLLLPGPLPGA